MFRNLQSIAMVMQVFALSNININQPKKLHILGRSRFVYRGLGIRLSFNFLNV